MKPPLQADPESGKVRSGRFSEGPILRHPSELDDPGLPDEPVFSLSQARLVFADHVLLQHDFPWLRDRELMRRHPGLESMTPAKRSKAIGELLERWLLEHAAFISSSQQGQTVVNEEIPVAPGVFRAFRPRRYGRALVVAVEHPGKAGEPAGLLDLKGVGRCPESTPDFKSHGNGLLFMHHALQEVMMQWMIDEIFRRAAPRFFTVPIYGLIYTGFNGHRVRRSSLPTAIIVRRAHRRPPYAVELPRTGQAEEMVKLEIEMVLRHYGITSSNKVTQIRVEDRDGEINVSYGGKPIRSSIASKRYFGSHRYRLFEGINVQLTRECRFNPSHAHLVDLAHYNVVSDFLNPVASLVNDRLANFGAAILPESPYFVRPDPKLALPFSEWSEEKFRDATEGCVPGITHHALSLTRDFVSGKKEGCWIRRQMDNPINRVLNQWRRNGVH